MDEETGRMSGETACDRMQVNVVDLLWQPRECNDILGLLGEGEVIRAPLLQSIERTSMECHRPSTAESTTLLYRLGPQ